jgi:hypothetical protein
VGVRFALHSKVTPVLEGCQSHQASEGPAKVTLTAKPQKGADLGNGFITGGKQRLGFGNPEALQIIEEGMTHDLPEESHELNLAHGAEPGCRGGVDNFAVVLVEELKEGTETLQILLSAFESVMHSHVVVVVLKQEQEQQP